MKKMTGRCAAVLALLLLLCVNASAQSSGEQVKILFTHDLHSHLDEYFIEGESVGGVARLKTLIDEKRGGAESVVLVDGGDFSMGTLYQTVYATQAVELTMLGYLGYDAATFGNHEFDYRDEGLSQMLLAASKNREEDPSLTLPKLLIANIDWNDPAIGPALETYNGEAYVPWTIIERGGVKIGIFGVMGEDAVECAPATGLEFQDVISVSRVYASLLREHGADIVICLSHSGVWSDTDRSEDEQLAMAVPEIDVIVSGHTHTRLDTPIRHGDTCIVSCGEYCQNLGELDLKRRSDGRWEVESYTLTPIDASLEIDSAVAQKLDEYRAQINETYLKRFGYTYDQVLAVSNVNFKQFSDFGTGLGGEPLGSIIADAYRYAVRQAEGEDYEYVAAAVAPMGTIRDTLQDGELTVWDAFNVCSLGIGKDDLTGYPLVSVYLTGAEIRTAAEIDISVSPLMSAARLYPSGVTWTYNPNRMILNKITDVKLVGENGEPAELEDDKLYRAVVGLYAAQMLGAVEDVSYGILSITPKDKNGVPIENYEDHIIYDREGNEVKEWYALASYLDSFPENENGISVIPSDYAEPDERKILEDSTALADILKAPNAIALTIYGVILGGLALLTVAVTAVVRKVRKKHS